MTDKQIIIDGVDVSGCNERSMCINCDTVTNCYYKQLKRKEQALDEIEKYLDAQQKYFDGEDYHNLLDIIDKTKERKCT